MRAVRFSRYGGPNVLSVEEAPNPDPGPGEVRIEVRAASINPIDWKVRSGMFAKEAVPDRPMIMGFDAAGVIDAVGEEVANWQVGDEVFGLGEATYAELAVLRSFARKPSGVDFATAAAAGTTGETALRVFGLLDLSAGERLLIDGGAGGVGTVAVQLARRRGYQVIATASQANHEYLRSLGATPISYGTGLADRVRAILDDGVDGVFDVVGKTDPAELIGLVATPDRVVSIANFDAADTGIKITSGGGDQAAALAEVAEALTAGDLRIPIQSFPFDRAAEAHQLSQDGHVRGKLVLHP